MLEEIHPTNPSQDAAATETEAPRTRRRRVITIEIPEELHALAVLTGTDPGKMVADLMAAQVGHIRAKAAGIMAEVAR